MRRLCLSLAADLDRALAEAAARAGRSKSAFARDLIARGLAATGPRPDPLDDLVGRYDMEPGPINPLVYGR